MQTQNADCSHIQSPAQGPLRREVGGRSLSLAKTEQTRLNVIREVERNARRLHFGSKWENVAEMETKGTGTARSSGTNERSSRRTPPEG